MESEKKSLTRRSFFGQCGRCAAWLASGFILKKDLSPSGRLASKDLTAEARKEKVKLSLLFALHRLKQDRPDWPNLGFDFRPVIEKYTSALHQKFPHYTFLVSLVSGPEEAEKIIRANAEQDVDGYAVFQLNCWNQVVQPAVATGQPVLYVDFLFAGSGGFLVYTSSLKRANRPNFGFIASDRLDDVVAAFEAFARFKSPQNDRSFSQLVEEIRIARTPAPGYLTCYPDELKLLSAEETLYRLKDAPILLFRDEQGGQPFQIMNIPVFNLPLAELNQAWAAADREEAIEIARKWWKGASLVLGVSWPEVINSAAMYLGMKALLDKYRARAITINCLGGFYGGHIHAYPCLGFHELNNQGLVGACEADLRSTATMTAFGLMTGARPGYISDPVIDISRRRIIYAHCVASNKVFGPTGPANPYEILTHSEDRQGAAVRSLLPAGYLTTSLEIDDGRREILLHQAKAIGNDFNDRACRTKLVAEPVGDLERLFSNWDRWGWHRVTFYGDLKEAAYRLAETLNWQVVQEA
jgi:hypothetical protein